MPKTRKSLELMPKPFAWMDIPAGQVTLTDMGGYLKESTTFAVGVFQMSKYLITNAQFDVFVNHDDGYKNPAWWGFSDEAKAWRKDNPQPRNTAFAGDTMPRTNVSWYEAVAFCGWMSAQTGEAITLPTEQEWQWVAQGSDVREYPWGNTFDSNRCNTKESGIGKITPVTQYEGKGDSPFGVVDMSGNVWKWCLTSNTSGNTNLIGSETRIVRGGSWSSYAGGACASYRDGDYPSYRDDNFGFFVVCHPSLK